MRKAADDCVRKSVLVFMRRTFNAAIDSGRMGSTAVLLGFCCIQTGESERVHELALIVIEMRSFYGVTIFEGHGQYNTGNR